MLNFRLIFLSLTLLLVPALSLAAPENVPTNGKHVKKVVKKNWTLTHHYEAKKVGQKWVYWRLVRNKDKQIVQEVIPYGRKIASNGGKLKTYGVKNFHTILKARMRTLKAQAKKKATKAVPQSHTFASTISSSSFTASSMPLGANPSTGYLPGSSCYNATIALNTPNPSQMSFTSTGSSSTASGQSNVAASVNASYHAATTSASASEVFTENNSYASSALSSTTFYNAFQLYTAEASNLSLNGTGTDAQQAGQFATTCGSYFVSHLPVGMLISGQSSIVANSNTAMTNLASHTAASGGIGDYTGAVAFAYSQQSSNTGYSYTTSFTTTVLGGAEGAGALFTTLWGEYAAPYVASECASTDVTPNPVTPATTTTGCCTSSNANASACSAFEAGSNYVASEALANFQTYYGPDLTAGSNLDGLYPFPNGIESNPAGQDAVYLDNELVTTVLPLSGAQYDDPYSAYPTQITTYITLLNQIGTLYSRVQYLTQALATPNACCGSSYSPTMNPAPLLDISGTYLSPLETIYLNDYNTILSNLTTCLTTTSSTVPASTACAPIIDAYNANILTAYDWYNSTTNGNTIAVNNNALQNTIALQYSGSVEVIGATIGWPNNSNILLDVVWGGGLPALTGLPGMLNGALPPSGYPAIIAFADAPYPNLASPQFTMTGPYVFMMPTTSITTPSISIPASGYQTIGYNLGEWGNVMSMGWQAGSGQSAVNSYINCGSSYPSFNNLCSISTAYYGVLATLNPIPHFFTQ